MRTLHTSGNGVYDEVDWQKPEISDDQIEVKARMTGICRSDIDMMTGNFPVLPLGVQGHEGLGVVARVGKNVLDVREGDFVATRSDAAYADYYNAGPGEYVQVPELSPKYILEPVACGVNAARKITDLLPMSNILLIGTGFLATVIYDTLRERNQVHVVGNANDEFWDAKSELKCKRFKSLDDITEQYDYIIDVKEDPLTLEADFVAPGAHYVVVAEKHPAVKSTFGRALWNATTFYFPSPRVGNFIDSMRRSLYMIENNDYDPSFVWTHSYKRDDFMNAFDEGLNRPKGYSRGYIIYDL